MSRCPFHKPPKIAEEDPEARSTPNSKSCNDRALVPPGPGIGSLSPDDLECPICLRLLHLPSSLPCGHTFCGPCIGRASQHRRQNSESSSSGGGIQCPVCRTVVPHFPKPNVLLSALIEKFMPGAAANRRAETVSDEAEERARYMIQRRVEINFFRRDRGYDNRQQQLLQNGEGISAGGIVIQAYIDGVSRCPMSVGSSIPIGFYVARVDVDFSPPDMHNPSSMSMSDETASTSAAEEGNTTRSAALWEMKTEKKLVVRPELQNKEDSSHYAETDSVATVVIHFQPRFQIPPEIITIPVYNNGGIEYGSSVDFIIDGRLVHH